MENTKFCFFCKTFRDDFIYLKRLLESYQKYNEDKIPMYICFPKDDQALYDSQIPNELKINTNLIYEEEFSAYTVATELNGVRPGYVNQEIIKLAFWEKFDVGGGYLPVDSDGEFIRPFYCKDFVAPDGVPYSILIEDNELQVDPVYYYACEWEARKKNIQKIYDAINFKSDVMLTAHGFCIMSCKVLADLKKNFMDVNGYSYKDLLKICGYEFSWYNLWLQKSKVIPLYIREPLFKCFHTFDQLLWYKLQGITVGDIARGYVGIVVNSNFQPNRGQDNPLDYNSTEIPDFFKSRLPKFLLREPTGKECVKILLKKIRQKLKKILHF